MPGVFQESLVMLQRKLTGLQINVLRFSRSPCVGFKVLQRFPGVPDEVLNSNKPNKEDFLTQAVAHSEELFYILHSLSVD